MWYCLGVKIVKVHFILLFLFFLTMHIREGWTVGYTSSVATGCKTWVKLLANSTVFPTHADWDKLRDAFIMSVQFEVMWDQSTLGLFLRFFGVALLKTRGFTNFPCINNISKHSFTSTYSCIFVLPPWLWPLTASWLIKDHFFNTEISQFEYVL